MATASRTKNRQGKAEQARATRRRITSAATALFLRDGFLTTTMAAIAAEAGVAVQTLYLSFGNKTAILSAAFDVALAGDDEPIPLQERPWARSVVTEVNGPAALAAFVDASAAIIERAGPLYEVIRAAAAEPEVAEILANNKRARHDTFAWVVETLARKKGFNPDVSTGDATGIVYAVQSEETFQLLVNEHGWEPRQWHDWALDTLTRQLFPRKSPRNP